MRKLFDVTDVVDDVQGVVDETVQRTTDNLHQVCNNPTQCHWPTCGRSIHARLSRLWLSIEHSMLAACNGRSLPFHSDVAGG